MAIFKLEGDVDDFLVTLNRLHPALKFTFEKEHDGKLPFLDILLERTELGFETGVYQKLTFSGQYIDLLGILQPTQTENERNRHSGTQSAYDMYEKRA